MHEYTCIMRAITLCSFSFYGIMWRLPSTIGRCIHDTSPSIMMQTSNYLRCDHLWEHHRKIFIPDLDAHTAWLH